MSNILNQIIKTKLYEVQRLSIKKSFKEALQQQGLSIIAEIKRKSPSKGFLSKIEKPVHLAELYKSGGASALSVLTDNTYFGGSLDDLRQVAHSLSVDLPVLRKDFIVDKTQIKQSIKNGADAILLIVSILKDKTKELLNYADKLELDVIVEVHNKEELEYALSINSQIIGINNRDLTDFNEDINICLKLKKLIPSNIITIAESAIRSTDDIQKIANADFDAVLVGEAFVRANDPANLINSFNKFSSKVY